MSRKQVLIVEDNDDLSKILRTRIEDLGCEVNVVSSGADLLGFFKDKKEPDIVILDIVLPDRNGVELLPSMKSKWPSAKIYVYTGHMKHCLNADLYKNYVEAFFIKTDVEDELVKAIKKDL